MGLVNAMPPAQLPYFQSTMGPVRARTRVRQVLGAVFFTTIGMTVLHTLRPSQSFVSDPLGATIHHGPSIIGGGRKTYPFSPALQDVWDDEDEEPDVDSTHWGSGHLPHEKGAPVELPPSKSRMPNHVYRADGLVEVNPEGRHPIYDLISRAEKEWKDKLDRQSRHLADAVDEYERRYGRPPPPNFDKW